MDQPTTKGTLYISPAFHQFLHEEIKKRGYEDEFSLNPSWTRSVNVESFDVPGLPIGLMYNEVERVDYEATIEGLKFYISLSEKYYGLN